MRIFLAGHRGLVGNEIKRKLERETDNTIVVRSRSELDLRETGAVHEMLEAEKPDLVIVAAAQVGGILHNQNNKLGFLRNNLAIQDNLIYQSQLLGIRRLIFLGSSCVYPKIFDREIEETDVLTGPLEPTNDAYALAKIVGIKSCQYIRATAGFDYRTIMPCNLYGKNDNFDDLSGHVIPSMMVKFHKAKMEGRTSVLLWGSGTPLREFLHAGDLASAVSKVISTAADEYFKICPDGIINVGSSDEVSIRELAEIIKRVTGYQGDIEWDDSKPDGTFRKKLNLTRLKQFDWQPETNLEIGIGRAYEAYLQQCGDT